MLFALEEYQARLSNVQKAMAKQGFDTLLITDPSNIYYLTGYDAWSFYTPQGILVTLADSMPIFIGRHMDAFAGVVKTTWLDEGHVRWYEDATIHSTTSHPFETFAQVVGQVAKPGSVVGVEMDSGCYTAKCHACLTAGLPDRTVKDAGVLVNWVRVVKSDSEIAMQKKAGKLSELGMQAAVETLGAGVRECDVAAAIYQALIKGTEDFGGDIAGIVPLLPCGDKAGAPHLTWTDRPYPDNTSLYIELSGVYYKYHAPLVRAFAIGKPSDDVERVTAATAEGLARALEAAKPGALAEDVERAFNSHMAKHGLNKPSRIGYSVGVGFPPDWGERTISLRPGDKTVLQKNMTLHCVCGMYYDTFGISLSESFAVTDSGIETFCNMPKDLIRIG